MNWVNKQGYNKLLNKSPPYVGGFLSKPDFNLFIFYV